MSEEAKKEAKEAPKKKVEPEAPTYIVSPSPHAHSGASVKQIMIDVIIALMPALVMAVYFFRMDAVRLVSA
jgi:Na+-transporting NADH:ubiquinone oxidoreductase subunit NqrB